jgi:hypothetical protein
MLTFAGGGVKVTQLTRRVKQGNRLQIDCRAAGPGERARQGVVLSWRWIADAAVVHLDHNHLLPGKTSSNCICGNDIIVKLLHFAIFDRRNRIDGKHNKPFSGYRFHFHCVCRQSHPVDGSPERSFGHLSVSRFERCQPVNKQRHLDRSQ